MRFEVYSRMTQTRRIYERKPPSPERPVTRLAAMQRDGIVEESWLWVRRRPHFAGLYRHIAMTPFTCPKPAQFQMQSAGRSEKRKGPTSVLLSYWSVMDLLKDLLLKYGRSAKLLNDAGGCNLLKKMVDCMIFPNGRHSDRVERQRRNLPCET